MQEKVIVNLYYLNIYVIPLQSVFINILLNLYFESSNL